MRIKLIDAAWLADKSLDVYASQFADCTEDRSSLIKHRTLCTQSNVMDIFKRVYDDMISFYNKCGYDKIVIIVPCFPLMRVKSFSALITRFICGNTNLLASYGISSNQFLDFFEHFIQLKCPCDYNEYENNVFWLKEKNTLLMEWKDSFIEYFGSSLINMECDDFFKCNPRFITTMENQTINFTEQSPLVKCKINNIISKI